MPSPNHKARASSLSLTRASTGPNTLRRGDLKISDPIPIPREGKDGLGPQTGVGSPDFQAQTSLRNAQDETQAKHDRPLPRSGAEGSNGYRDPFNARAASHAITTKTSATNPHDSISSAQSRLSMKDKGLRATFRKIFGRKASKRSTVDGLIEEHANDASANATTGAPVTRTPTRSSSFLIQDVTRSSALNSHSPFAPFLASDRNSRASEHVSSFQANRRRNTLPSLVLSQQEEDNLRSMLGSQAIRPGSKAGPKVEKKEPMINNPNRRSRSAGALRETAREHRMSPIQWRRRGDDIDHWPKSDAVDFASESQSKRELAPGKTTEISRPPTRGNKASPPSSPAAAPPPPPITMTAAQSFGDLLVPQQDDSASLEQRITTMEVKLMDLEYAIAKLQGCEISRPAASGNLSMQKSQTENIPSPQNSSQSLSSSASYSNNPKATFLSSPADSPNPSGDDEGFQSSRIQRASRATTVRPTTALHQPPPSTMSKSATYPPSSSNTQNPPTPALDTSAFNHLLTMIQTEQSARRTLELQIQRLQREADEIRSPTYMHYNTSLGYPTPSPESFSHDAANPPPPIATRRHNPMPGVVPNAVIPRCTGTNTSSRTGSSGENSRQTMREPLKIIQHQPSEFQSAFDDRSESGTETDDDGFLDVYETPTEARDRYGYDRFRSNESMRGDAMAHQPPQPPRGMI